MIIIFKNWVSYKVIVLKPNSTSTDTKETKLQNAASLLYEPRGPCCHSWQTMRQGKVKSPKLLWNWKCHAGQALRTRIPRNQSLHPWLVLPDRSSHSAAEEGRVASTRCCWGLVKRNSSLTRGGSPQKAGPGGRAQSNSRLALPTLDNGATELFNTSHLKRVQDQGL